MKTKDLVKLLTRGTAWDGTSPKKVRMLRKLAHHAAMYTTTHDSPENRLAMRIAGECDRLLERRKKD